MLLFTPHRVGLEAELDSCPTYRLRIAEIEPHHGPDITGILAVESETGTS